MTTLTLEELEATRKTSIMLSKQLASLTRDLEFAQSDLVNIITNYLGYYNTSIRTIEFVGDDIKVSYDDTFRGETTYEELTIPFAVCTSVENIRKYFKDKKEVEDKLEEEKARKQREESERIIYESLKKKFENVSQ